MKFEEMQAFYDAMKEEVRLCNRCNNEVEKSELEHYSYQCYECDEDLYEFETYELSKRGEKGIERVQGE